MTDAMTGLSSRTVRAKLLKWGTAALFAASTSSLFAGSVTYDFTTDPTTLASNPIKVYQTGYADSTGASVYWKPTGGNPGGFLGLTWPLGSSSSIIVFPDIDQGKLVTAFKFDTDLRIGNPQQNDRAADGFSINFARSNDPVFHKEDGADPSPNDFATAGAVETGTQTGIAISFDTWSGNTLPDGNDIEGIIVRVDNKTVLRQSVPTRNGACDDPTSLQTGARTTAYWDAAHANGTLPDAAFDPAAYTNLCWQHLSVEVDTNAQLTVIYKGATILDHFQTTYFPSAGGLVLAGRTGGSDENTHFDNLTLTTVAVAADTQKPTVPGNLRVLETGALRVLLANDAATDNSGRVAYEIEQNGTNLTTTFISTTNDVRNLQPNTSYTFRIRATDVSGNKSDWSAPVTVKTGALVQDTIFGAIKIYGTTDNPISGTAVDALTSDSRYPDSPDRTAPINGMSFGEPNFGDTFGDNIGFRIAGTITPPETGDYNFFVRSDDSSSLFLNTSGAAIPDALNSTPIAQETGCCNPFLEQNADGTVTQTTTAPIHLVAGQKYGILFLVKEGGGGDWGQVAWRKVGDTTPASQLPPIRYPAFTPESFAQVDPVGAVVNITQQPQSVTTFANEPITLNVGAQTASPYNSPVIYQWFKNGQAISGANSSSYTIPVAAQSDNGAKYSVLVAVQGKSVTSSDATLTINADTKKPTIASATGADTMGGVVLTFSEPISASTATNAANYSLSGGATVTGAKQLNANTVQLTTSAQTPDTQYVVTVNNLQDNAGNAIAGGSTIQFHSFVQKAGQARVLFYTGIPGTAVSALTSAPSFPNSPNDSRAVTTLASPDSYGDNYGAMIRGYIAPTETASYNFFIRSDDASALFLNTTGEASPDPLTSTPIAQETGCCNAFVEPGDPKTSDAIPLTAGKHYGFTVLLKEGGGGDYVQVAWRKSTDSTDAATLTPIPGQFLGAYFPATPSDITGTNDTVTAFGGNSPTAEVVSHAFDNVTSKYLNFGSGPNNQSAPFKGPVGLTVTPASGASIVTGIRFYTANDAPERDPIDYTLEGSNDGTTFTQISSGPLALPTTRNNSGLALDPTKQANQLVNFSNVTPYKTYRVTFNHVRNDTTANSMQIGEIELLGFAAAGSVTGGGGPTLSVTSGTAGSITITWAGGGTLEATDALGAGANWQTAGTGGSVTVNTSGKAKFFRVRQ